MVMVVGSNSSDGDGDGNGNGGGGGGGGGSGGGGTIKWRGAALQTIFCTVTFLKHSAKERVVFGGMHRLRLRVVYHDLEPWCGLQTRRKPPTDRTIGSWLYRFYAP
ncbi:hypothetical protein HZH68_017028 [Vespula germanica]|uniref:Uncharacterized protein n=1 Tax=Vespula germanica TaxID=30212 RepID=A0A834IY80_VESGE|nr:hypothetical protein HZH68_017028 [Vespula germanica]